MALPGSPRDQACLSICHFKVLAGVGRNKITFYWNKRDQGLIWDYTSISVNLADAGINPPLLAYGFENNTPPKQADDVYVDLRVTRWDYHGAPKVAAKKSIGQILAEKMAGRCLCLEPEACPDGEFLNSSSWRYDLTIFHSNY